jgi:hypothetical protein
MIDPLTYPDHPRDSNLAEFFLAMFAACLKQAFLAALALLLELSL